MNLFHSASQSFWGLAAMLGVVSASFGLPLPVQAQARLDQNNAGVRNADAELNKTYAQVQQSFNEAGRAALQLVQRSWIAFKEQDLPLFARMAIFGNDRERIEDYQIGAIGRRCLELKTLGKKPTSPDFPENEARTVREAEVMLNQTYRSCLDLLPADSIEPFKAAQRLWLQFRVHHCQFDTALRNGIPEPEVARVLTVVRVVQLRHYRLVLLSARLLNNDPGEGPDTKPPETVKLEVNVPDIYRFAR